MATGSETLIDTAIAFSSVGYTGFNGEDDCVRRLQQDNAPRSVWALQEMLRPEESWQAREVQRLRRN